MITFSGLSGARRRGRRVVRDLHQIDLRTLVTPVRAKIKELL